MIILLAIIPPEFLNASSTAYTPTPQNTSFANILGTNETATLNFTGSPPHDFGNIDFGGWHIQISEKNIAGSGEQCLWIRISDAWYFYFFNSEDFQYRTTDGNTSITTRNLILTWGTHYVLKIETLDALMATNQTGIIYLTSSRTTIRAYFYYDQTLYATPSLAYVAGKLQMILGIDFNERNTQVNAWSLISSFLTFQLLPNVDPILSLLLEIPMWVCEGYLTFIFVLRVLGAVFGGGA
jgi:hypothetical protein